MSWSFLDLTGLSRFFGRLPEKMVTTETTQTISGTKSFSSTIIGSVSGSAASASKDGSGNVIADTYATKTALSDAQAEADAKYETQEDAATHLTKTEAASAYVQTAAVDQTIGGTKTFSKPIAGSVTGSSGSCTGNAASATELQTARTINGTSFNGTANITTANWGTARNITITDGTNTSTAVSVNGSANVSLKLPATIKATFVGNITGNVTGNCSGSSGSCTGNAATATTATTAKVCTGNSATATKLATARTIALSGAATGTATGFDGSGNITIPVTALASSAIRAQWYAAYPDGAEAHNAMWGGRDITAAFNNGTVSANIANGTFKDIFPGDYITKQVTISGTAYTVNWVIADCDYWWHKGDNTAMETHHVVIVPQAPIFSANMNDTNTTEGGYAGSRMYRETIPACATGIVNAFGSDHILTFRDGITNSVDTSHISSGIPQWTGTPGWWGGWVSVQCDLMSEKMVYGAPICAAGAMDNSMATRQMSAFRLSERLINYNRQWWWLRDVVSSALFALVRGGGNAGAGAASDSGGVRPFALLV